VGLIGADDSMVLAWAARERRVLLSHDVTTLVHDAYTRADAGLPMPGVLAIVSLASLGRVIDDIVLLAEGSVEGDLEGQVVYVLL